VISYRRSSASSGCKEQIAAYVCELAETVRDTAVGLASQIEEPRSLSELLTAACAARSTGSRTNARTARWSCLESGGTGPLGAGPPSTTTPFRRRVLAVSWLVGVAGVMSVSLSPGSPRGMPTPVGGTLRSAPTPRPRDPVADPGWQASSGPR